VVKGVSFLETAIVLVIAGIMVSFAMPGYAKYIEKTRGKRAESNLEAIYNMEKLYKLDNGVYYECATAPCLALYYSCPQPPLKPPCTLKLINDELGLFIVDPYFTYNITTDGASGGYKVTAKRLKEGLCSEQTMTITSANRTITKSCAVW